MVVGSNLARGKILTASIGSLNSLYLCIYLLHESASVSDPWELKRYDVCEIIFPHF